MWPLVYTNIRKITMNSTVHLLFVNNYTFVFSFLLGGGGGAGGGGFLLLRAITVLAASLMGGGVGAKLPNIKVVFESLRLRAY